MTFEEYWKDKSKHENNDDYKNYPNPIDRWFFKNGWEIFYLGGLIPERIWIKENFKFSVRNNEFLNCYKIIRNEYDIGELIKKAMKLQYDKSVDQRVNYI